MRSPVIHTISVWPAMNSTIQDSTPKWIVRATCRLSSPLPVPNFPAIDGAWSSPVTKASGAAMKIVVK